MPMGLILKIPIMNGNFSDVCVWPSCLGFRASTRGFEGF